MNISLKELEHVAELARLSIPENELIAYTRQLDDILKSIEKLKSLIRIMLNLQPIYCPYVM